VSDDGRVTMDDDPKVLDAGEPSVREDDPNGRDSDEPNVTVSDDSSPPASRRRTRGRSVLGWVVFVVVVLLISTGTRAYALESYFVPSTSMSPTLMPGDRIMVNKLASTIHRGDIVVFHAVPADKGGPPTLVKRVIGLPGETISSVGGTVLIDGKPLAQPWLPVLAGECTEQSENIKPTKIAPDHYFVMGDCRGDSDDSRYFGTVPDSNIVGKVDLIIWRSGHPWIHWF
jgi:signal peptidase I